MSDSLPPMTDETLAAIEARLGAATPGPWSRFGREIGNEDGDSWYLGHDIEGPSEAERGQFERVADAELIANAPTDLRRLLDEVKRLDAWRRALSERVSAKDAELDKTIQGLLDMGVELAAARSECAALAAKVEAARQGLAENLAEYEQVIASFKPPKTMSREEEEHRDLARAETAEARNCLAIFDAAMGSGMPHTPAQGCTCGAVIEYNSLTQERTERRGLDRRCPEHGTGSAILPAQEAQERPETREGDTGMGTGVQGPHGRTEAGR